VRRAVPLAVLAALVSAAPAAAQAPTALDRAVDFVGSPDALDDLRTFSYRASGEVFVFNEGFTPGARPGRAATFTANVRYRLRGADAVRLDSARNSLGTPRPVTEVVNGRRGSITGQYANQGAPLDEAPMTPDRQAAILREQRLLNPHILLQAALDNRRLVRSARGRTLVLRDSVAPIRLTLSRAGRLIRLTTQEHDYQRRTVNVRVDYGGWGSAGRGVRMPSIVTLKIDGFTIHRETRTRMRANPSIASSVFATGSQQSPFSPSLASRGAKTSQWLNSFAALGFPKDGPYSTITETVVAPGVILLTGVSNQSLVVERSSGVVVIDSSVHDLRAETVISYIQRKFPGKAITHVVSLHHHADHNSGMRPYVARGARAVVHQSAAGHFQRVFADRNSSILPDALDRVETPAQIDVVPASGNLLLPDATRPIRVYPEPSSHAADTAFAYVAGVGVLMLNGDTCQPGTAAPGCRVVNDQVRANGLSVSQVATAHAPRPVSYAEFQRGLAG
jgi:glyoxylase-like metal-dependent hydrolase (beta-lactamase superfamily II)